MRDRLKRNDDVKGQEWIISVKKDRPEWFPWIIVSASFVILALTYGAWYSFSVLFVALSERIRLEPVGRGRSVFPLCHCSRCGRSVCRSPRGPFRSARNPSFRVLHSGVGLGLSSLTRTWWHLYLFYGLIAATGLERPGGFPTSPSSNNGLGRREDWLRESSPRELESLFSLLLLWYSISSAGRLAERLSIAGHLIPLISASLTILLLRTPPRLSDSGDCVEGRAAPARDDSLILDEAWASVSWTVRRAASTRSFWLLMGFLFCPLPSGRSRF